MCMRLRGLFPRLRGLFPRLRGLFPRLRGLFPRLRGLFPRLRGLFPRLRLLWADSAYRGQLIAWVAAFAGWVLEIVQPTPEQREAKGFAVQPHRWVVERTFAWLVKFRRLVRDYEETEASSEAWVRLAMIHIMVRKLAHSP